MDACLNWFNYLIIITYLYTTDGKFHMFIEGKRGAQSRNQYEKGALTI